MQLSPLRKMRKKYLLLPIAGSVFNWDGFYILAFYKMIIGGYRNITENNLSFIGEGAFSIYLTARDYETFLASCD